MILRRPPMIRRRPSLGPLFAPGAGLSRRSASLSAPLWRVAASRVRSSDRVLRARVGEVAHGEDRRRERVHVVDHDARAGGFEVDSKIWWNATRPHAWPATTSVSFLRTYVVAIAVTERAEPGVGLEREVAVGAQRRTTPAASPTTW